MKSKIVKLGMCFFLTFIFIPVSDLYSQGRNRNVQQLTGNRNFIGRNSQNLTDKQIRTIQNIQNECFAEQEYDQNILYEKISILNTLISSGNRDKELVNNMINELNDEINVLQERILKTRNNSQAKIDAIIPDEQEVYINNGIGNANRLGMNNSSRTSDSYGYGFGNGNGNGYGRRTDIVPGQGRMQLNQVGLRGNGLGYYCRRNYQSNVNSNMVGRNMNSGFNDGRLHRNRQW
ncbi:hypothetical protein ACFLTI_04765 [Bacteroidota bacterium]